MSALASRALAWSQPSFVTEARLVPFGNTSTEHPEMRRLVEIDGDDVELSALELDAANARILLRVWNRAAAPSFARIALREAALAGRTITGAAHVGLDGREGPDLPLSDGWVRVDLAPHGLVSLAFALEPHA